MDQSRFVWYELLTTDVPAATGFYRNVIGWGLQSFEGSAEPYHIFTRGEEGVAGIMKKPAEAEAAPPHWMGYLWAANVDETTSLARRKGAKIQVEPKDIPEVGRFSVIQDPQGVYVAVFTPRPGSPAPSTGGPGVGDFSWNELVSTDIDAAFAFYHEVFGFVKKEAHDMGPMGIYQIFGTDDRTLGGMYVKPADMKAPPHWLFYTRVDDLDAAVQRVRTGKGQVLHGPADVPGGDRVAVCMDPQGAAFALHVSKG
jgi:predicted enzyme related to lactoylglutathione lyase